MPSSLATHGHLSPASASIPVWVFQIAWPPLGDCVASQSANTCGLASCDIAAVGCVDIGASRISTTWLQESGVQGGFVYLRPIFPKRSSPLNGVYMLKLAASNKSALWVWNCCPPLHMHISFSAASVVCQLLSALLGVKRADRTLPSQPRRITVSDLRWARSSSCQIRCKVGNAKQQEDFSPVRGAMRTLWIGPAESTN